LTLLDDYVEGGKLDLVFEYMDDSLRRIFKYRQGLIDRAIAATYLHQACRGLAFLHQRGIAHMDLSMSNLMVRRDPEGAQAGGTLKIVDLGCARDVFEVLTFPTEREMTEYIRAPEVWLGGSEKGGGPIDVFSLGVTAAALICGTLIFSATGGLPAEAVQPYEPAPLELSVAVARCPPARQPPCPPEAFMRQRAVLGPIGQEWRGSKPPRRFAWVAQARVVVLVAVSRCAAQRSTAQHSTAPHSTAQRGTAQHSAAQHSIAQHSTARRSTAQRSTAQHSTAQHSTAQYSTVQGSAVQHSTAQRRCSTVQYGAAQRIITTTYYYYYWASTIITIITPRGSRSHEDSNEGGPLGDAPR
jgi:serine/threonine protein kinase